MLAGPLSGLIVQLIVGRISDVCAHWLRRRALLIACTVLATIADHGVVLYFSVRTSLTIVCPFLVGVFVFRNRLLNPIYSGTFGTVKGTHYRRSPTAATSGGPFIHQLGAFTGLRNLWIQWSYPKVFPFSDATCRLCSVSLRSFSWPRWRHASRLRMKSLLILLVFSLLGAVLEALSHKRMAFLRHRHCSLRSVLLTRMSL